MRSNVTIWSLLSVGRRLWVVVLVGLLGTGLLVWQASQIEPVFSGRVTVLFVPPASAGEPATANALQLIDQSLIATAGVIELRMTAGSPRHRMVSSNVTLLSQGVTSGQAVVLPNQGGQWTYQFQRPELDVHVTGPTEDDVRRDLARLVSRIDAELAAQQRREQVPESLLIRTELVPPVFDVRQGAGSVVRAAGAAALLGSSLTVAAVVLLDRRMNRGVPAVPGRRRRNRRQAAPA